MIRHNMKQSAPQVSQLRMALSMRVCSPFPQDSPESLVSFSVGDLTG
jgi:hypothetical protein